MNTRRSFLRRMFGTGAALAAASVPAAHAETSTPSHDLHGTQPASRSLSKRSRRGASAPVRTTPVVTTDIGDLPFQMDGEWKVFRLTAHVMQQQIAPDKTISVWGFNGSAPGPTIQVTQGDKVRVIFTNNLPEPSSIHWHGFEDHIGFDGMPGISQEPVKPGETFTYEFTIHQEGTYFYHSHMAMQEMAGMLGAFIMHPRVPYRPHCDKDFVINLQAYYVMPNNTVPNTMNMEFNWLLLNGKAGPATTPLIVRQGERVRVRFINLSMNHHPMHVHGHTFYTTGTEGGRIPETAWWPGNTVLVGVAQARDVEFIANNAGDWMLHCHLPHHMMNQMATQAGPMLRDVGKANGRQLPDPQASKLPANPLAEHAGFAEGQGANTQLDAGMMGMKGVMGSAMADMPGMQHEPSGKPGDVPMSRQQMRNEMAFDMTPKSMADQNGEIAPDANRVPNFPQDAYMEGPMMLMDKLVERPENFGLRPGWSRFMQGMMTFVRVLPPDAYDEVVSRMQKAGRPNDPYRSIYTS